MTNREIYDNALNLEPEKRFKLAERLLQSLENENPDIEERWSIEAEKRLQAYKNGEIESFSLEETFNDL